MANRGLPSEHWPLLRTTAAIVGVLVAVAAFGTAYYQAVLTRRTTEAQAWQGVNEQANYLSGMFIDHPELRPYFYDGVPISKNDPNYNKVMSYAELYLNFIDDLGDDYVYALKGMEENGKYRRYWDRTFKDTFAMSPALQAYAKEEQAWYPTDFSVYYPKQVTGDPPLDAKPMAHKPQVSAGVGQTTGADALPRAIQ